MRNKKLLEKGLVRKKAIDTYEERMDKKLSKIEKENQDLKNEIKNHLNNFCFL